MNKTWPLIVACILAFGYHELENLSECPVEIQLHLYSDHPLWSLLVALSMGVLSFSCRSHSHWVVNAWWWQSSCPAQPSPAQWVSVSHKPQQRLDAHHCFPSFELQVYKMIPSFWKRQTPSHCSINNFSVYRYWGEINFLNPWTKILLNAHQSQNLTDYIFFSFPNPVCFSPPGPWNMPFYLLRISLSFPSPAKLLLSLSYIPQAALSNYLFHEDKTSCHVFPHNPGGYGVMAYLYMFSPVLWVLSCLEVLSFESIQPRGRCKESPVGDRTTLEHIFSQKSVESPGNKFAKDDYDLSRRLGWVMFYKQIANMWKENR